MFPRHPGLGSEYLQMQVPAWQSWHLKPSIAHTLLTENERGQSSFAGVAHHLRLYMAPS